MTMYYTITFTLLNLRHCNAKKKNYEIIVNIIYYTYILYISIYCTSYCFILKYSQVYKNKLYHSFVRFTI